MHHNNYYFIRKLSSALFFHLKGARLYECYSQNKDELVMAFVLPDRSEFYIIASLGSEFSCLHFSEEIHRAKRNTVTLFEELLGAEVTGYIQYDNERAFALQMEGGYLFVFKLFGNRSNLLLFKEGNLLKVFKNNLKQDKHFIPQGKAIDLSEEHLHTQGFDIFKVFFTMDELFREYFIQQGYQEKSAEEKYRLIGSTLSYLESPGYYITKVQGKVVLSVLPVGTLMEQYTSPIEAVNAFYAAHFRYNHLYARKQRLLAQIQARIRATQSYIEKTGQKIQELESEKSPSQLADVIMANLPQIQQGMEKVRLFNFYSGSETEIRLKKDISPQKNAELLYKKAKKKPLELENLRKQMDGKEKLLEVLLQDERRLETFTSHKDLEPMEALYTQSKEKEEKDIPEKFRVFSYMGYQILVGKGAENNDELTQKYTHKNDLWLHAKDVAGSHVVVKFQAGKKFPRPVIEAAASLAAYYSKRKNENLCPVIYTEKKFVRKVKGAAKGQVMVDKETVIMVTPKEFPG